jgi:hypothetical protein
MRERGSGGGRVVVSWGLDLLIRPRYHWIGNSMRQHWAWEPGLQYRSLRLDRELQWELFITLGTASVDACSFTYL